MTPVTRILWSRAILYGLAAEAGLVVVAIAVTQVAPAALTTVAVVGSFVLPLVLAISLGRRLSSRFELHGAIIGAVGVVLYLLLVEAQRRWGPPVEPQPLAYLVAHGLKVVGGALGGVLARRRAAAPSRMIASV